MHCNLGGLKSLYVIRILSVEQMGVKIVNYRLFKTVQEAKIREKSSSYSAF